MRIHILEGKYIVVDASYDFCQWSDGGPVIFNALLLLSAQ